MRGGVSCSAPQVVPSSGSCDYWSHLPGAHIQGCCLAQRSLCRKSHWTGQFRCRAKPEMAASCTI